MISDSVAKRTQMFFILKKFGWLFLFQFLFSKSRPAGKKSRTLVTF